MQAVFFVLFLIPSLLLAQIDFHNVDLDDLIKKSKEEGKLVFLSTYTEWCEPCQEMEEYTYTDLEVANFFNSRFVNAQMDMEVYPGLEIAEQFNIAVFPSFLFLNQNGEVVHRGCGAMDAAELLHLAEDVLNGTNVLLEQQKKYQSGERSVEFLQSYFAQLEDACLDAEKEAKKYLSTIELGELVKDAPWEVFAAYNWDIYSREFQFLLQNRELFEDAIGKELVDAKIYDTFLSQYQEVFSAEELHDFGMRALLHEMKGVTFLGSDTLEVMMNLHHAEFTEDWSSYAEYAIGLVGMSGIDDPEQLNELAWKFYLFVENKNQLEIASSWAKQAVDVRPEPSWIDTYASLQFKLGKRKKAVELAQKALEIARELNDNTSHYEYQLKKFQNQ